MKIYKLCITVWFVSFHFSHCTMASNDVELQEEPVVVEIDEQSDNRLCAPFDIVNGKNIEIHLMEAFLLYLQEKGVQTIPRPIRIDESADMNVLMRAVVCPGEKEMIHFILYNRQNDKYGSSDNTDRIYYMFNATSTVAYRGFLEDYAKICRERRAWRLLKLKGTIPNLVEFGGCKREIDKQKIMVDMYTSRLVQETNDWSCLFCSVTGALYAITGSLESSAFRRINRDAIKNVMRRRTKDMITDIVTAKVVKGQHVEDSILHMLDDGNL